MISESSTQSVDTRGSDISYEHSRGIEFNEFCTCCSFRTITWCVYRTMVRKLHDTTGHLIGVVLIEFTFEYCRILIRKLPDGRKRKLCVFLV